jgi:hypothetical protein
MLQRPAVIIDPHDEAEPKARIAILSQNFSRTYQAAWRHVQIQLQNIYTNFETSKKTSECW